VNARPFPDLFDRDAFGLPASGGAVPDTILAGLAKLSGGPPLWGGEIEWLELVDRMRAWSCRWYGPAAASGWSKLQLFGLDAVAPRARVQHMGGAFLACRPDCQTIAVDSAAITLVVRTASRMRIYKSDPEGAVLAWELRK
jgi:hypothetical protein